MLRKIRIFSSEIWLNPKDAFRIVLITFGILLSAIFGCICIGVHEGGKIVLDKIKTKG